jgi:hypothetical protein
MPGGWAKKAEGGSMNTKLFVIDVKMEVWFIDNKYFYLLSVRCQLLSVVVI